MMLRAAHEPLARITSSGLTPNSAPDQATAAQGRLQSNCRSSVRAKESLAWNDTGDGKSPIDHGSPPTRNRGLLVPPTVRQDRATEGLGLGELCTRHIGLVQVRPA